MLYKEDDEDAKERMAAWWDHEILDRPVIAYTYRKPDVPAAASWDSWFMAKHVDAIEDALDLWEKSHNGIEFGGEQFPVFWPNYGAGIMASLFGAECTFKSETVWFSRPTSLDEIVPLLEGAQMNKNNPWYARLLRITEVASRRGEGKFQVATTDLGGILDILASFLSPRDIFYAMRKNPGLIDTCRAIILEKENQVYDALTRIILEHCHGTTAWLSVFNAKRWYPLQCDFAYMLSPAWFKRFVLPDLVTQCQHMDYAIYHLDGVRQLPYLDDLLAIPELTGIQWVPGEGKPPMGADEWMPVYKKIQAAGKNIVAGTSPELTAKMYRELDPKGLYVACGYPGKIWAEFFLPPFMGGKGGIDDED